MTEQKNQRDICGECEGMAYWWMAGVRVECHFCNGTGRTAAAQPEQGAQPYKFFRCESCGFSGPITMEEIAKHRSRCAYGPTRGIQPAAETDKEKVLKVYRDAHVADNCGIVVIVTNGCVIGESHTTSMDYAEEYAWHAAASRLPAQPDSAAKVEESDICKMQRSRDKWRRYAYGVSERPPDFLGIEVGTNSTAIDKLNAELKAAREEIARLKGLVKP